MCPFQVLMVFPLSGRSLGVNLLRLPYFKEDKPVCTEAEYLSERGGDKFPYKAAETVSYEEVGPMMDADIRQKFPKVSCGTTKKFIKMCYSMFL